jgi:hypothetical protein
MAYDGVSLNEQFENLTRRFGDWEGYKQDYFVRLDPKQRANELSLFDMALHDEAKPSKEFAEHWTRRRELERLDAMCKRAGR